MTKYDLDKYLAEGEELVAHTVRFPKVLKERMVKLAEKKGVSLNAWIVAALSLISDSEEGKKK